jgi:predicted transcriptional regulator
MSREQMLANAAYKYTVKILEELMKQGLINESQKRKINRLNVEKIKPSLAELYL